MRDEHPSFPRSAWERTTSPLCGESCAVASSRTVHRDAERRGGAFPRWSVGTSNRLGRSLALPVLLLLASMAPAQNALKFGDVSVSVVAPPPGQPMFGYNDYSVSVSNRSKDRSHVVGLSLPRQSYGQRGNYLRSVRRTVEVGPGETARVSLYQTVWLPFAGSGMGVDIDGVAQEQQLSVSMTSRPQNSYYGGPYGRMHMTPAIALGGPSMGTQFRVLASRSLPADFQRGMHGLFLPGRPIEPGIGIDPGPGGFPPGGLPPGPRGERMIE